MTGGHIITHTTLHAAFFHCKALSPYDCAQVWDVETEGWWGLGEGSWLPSHHSSSDWGEAGGIAQGPFMSARGAVGSQGLSPAAADWVTSWVVPSQHT